MGSESPSGKPHIGKKKGEFRSAFQDSIPYLTLGFQLAAAVLLFFFIGYWIDNELGISPAGKLAGALIGIAGGLINFFKSVNSMNENDERNRTSNKHEN